jgi:hypothetical protein
MHTRKKFCFYCCFLFSNFLFYRVFYKKNVKKKKAHKNAIKNTHALRIKMHVK